MPLSPDLALAYLRFLSVDVLRAAITTAGGGRFLADAEHAIHVDAGPHALGTLLDLDLRTILDDLAAR